MVMIVTMKFLIMRQILVAAITGSTGLIPVVKTAKIPIALANKESLVCSDL